MSYTYAPDSPLALLVRNARPIVTLDDVAAACCNLTLGIAVIGKLMSCSNASGELSPSDLGSLGALLTDLAATAHELAEMERASADGGS